MFQTVKGHRTSQTGATGEPLLIQVLAERDSLSPPLWITGTCLDIVSDRHVGTSSQSRITKMQKHKGAVRWRCDATEQQSIHQASDIWWSNTVSLSYRLYENYPNDQKSKNFDVSYRISTIVTYFQQKKAGKRGSNKDFFTYSTKLTVNKR